MSDKKLAQLAAAGDEAAAKEFDERFRKRLEDNLIAKCGDAEDRDAVKDIVANVIGQCCSTDKLVRAYEREEASSGRGIRSLEAFLSGWCFNELRTHWRKKNRNPVTDSIDGLEERNERPVEVGAEDDEAIDAAGFKQLMLEATAYAFDRLRTQFPERLAVLRLADLHGISNVQLANSLGFHEADIHHLRNDGVVFLQSEISTYLFSKLPKGTFTFEDVRDFAKEAEEIVHDEERAEEILRKIRGESATD